MKLTISIEDAREVERRRLLGIDDSDAPTREDLAAALEEVSVLLLFSSPILISFLFRVIQGSFIPISIHFRISYAFANWLCDLGCIFSF